MAVLVIGLFALMVGFAAVRPRYLARWPALRVVRLVRGVFVIVIGAAFTVAGIGLLLQ
jgi:hypothetical protein